MDEQARTLLQQIGRTGRAMFAAFEAQVGLPLPRWRVLMAVQAQPGLSQRALATQLDMDPAALTRLLKPMEAEGCVARQTDPQDNRQTTVSLTPAGEALMARMQPVRARFAERALAGVSDAEVAQVRAVLALLEAQLLALKRVD